MTIKTPLKNGKKKVTESGRDPKTGQFVPGYAGGPGAPLGTKHMGTLLADALKELASGSEDKSWAQMVVKRLIMNAVAGKEKSIELIFERMDGKVKDEFKGEISGLVAHAEVSEDKLEGVIDEFIKSFRKKLNAKNKTSNPRTD